MRAGSLKSAPLELAHDPLADVRARLYNGSPPADDAALLVDAFRRPDEELSR